jgi:adenosine deaminase
LTGRGNDMPRILADFIRLVPKAEMHIHLEGAVRWDTIREVHPSGSALPERPPWYHHNRLRDFEEFRAVFDEFVKPSTGTAELVERHVLEVLSGLARQGVLYTELSISPYFHTARGLTPADVLLAVDRGRVAAESGFPIDARIIVGLNRNLTPEKFNELVELSVSLRNGNGGNVVDGIDLHGDEADGLHEILPELFATARQHGLKTKAHAGELCGPSSVLDALDKLGAKELCHGVRGSESPAVLKRLVEEGIVLHACPTSNVILGVADSLAVHPLPRLHASGCLLTINSDDPLIFNTDLTQEFMRVAGTFGYGASDIAGFSLNAFNCAMVAESRKAHFRERVMQSLRQCETILPDEQSASSS